MIDRRTFIGSLALGTLALPFGVRAQQIGKTYRIGMLWAGKPAENVSRENAFRDGLRELVWIEGRTIAFEQRWADGQYERLPTLAAQLVALKVDLIVANNGTPAAQAALAATREIPIVVPAMSDPIANRLIANLARPGGNLTGLSNMASELYPKRLALLKEAMPGIARAALLLNGKNPFSTEAERLSQATGKSLGVRIDVVDVRDPRDFGKAFERMSLAGTQAVLAGTEFLFLGSAKELGDLALAHRLPLIAGYYAPGVLLAYSFDNMWSYRRAATYVDKILKGAKAGDLPIEPPTHFTLVIDLRTAKALGLTIPQSLLLRADEVIE